MSGPSPLDGELAAFSYPELAQFVSRVCTLLEAADDGTFSYCLARARILTTLMDAVENRMADFPAATIIPFPKTEPLEPIL